MIILALDLGTKCGFAYDPLLKVPDIKQFKYSGVFDLTPKRHESAGMRFIHFKQSLEPFKDFELIVYEEVARHLGTHAAHIYGGLVAILQSFCIDNGIEYQGIPVGTIKKHATGKGNANKQMMIEACEAKLGVKPIDDNEADALWLLDYIIKTEVKADGKK